MTRRYKNGNIDVRLEPDRLESIQNGRTSVIEELLWELDSVDTYAISDEYCLSNYDMGCTLYSCYADVIFILSFGEALETLPAGKTMKLYARTPDKYDREIIQQWEEGG